MNSLSEEMAGKNGLYYYPARSPQACFLFSICIRHLHGVHFRFGGFKLGLGYIFFLQKRMEAKNWVIFLQGVRKLVWMKRHIFGSWDGIE